MCTIVLCVRKDVILKFSWLTTEQEVRWLLLSLLSFFTSLRVQSAAVIQLKWWEASLQENGDWEIPPSVSVGCFFWQAIGFECSMEHRWGERKDNICLSKPVLAIDGDIRFLFPHKKSPLKFAQSAHTVQKMIRKDNFMFVCVWQRVF